MPKLGNARWESFAAQTAAGRSRGDAYVAAGFRAKNHGVAAKRGSALFGRPEIRARVVELEDELRSGSIARTGLDREWVLKGLRENLERSLQSKPVLDRQGRPTGEYTFNAAGANRALELVGKELGMFVERYSIESLDSQLDGMSPAELRAFVKTAATDVGLRLLDMTNDETREFIMRNAERVGLHVGAAPTH